MFIKRKLCETKILWKAKEAAALTGGINSREWLATGVSINVDSINPGDLFFAAHGDDLEKVFRSGASAVVIPHGMNVREGWACLKVANTYEALRSFARAARFKTHAMVIAVQGEQERLRISKSLSAIAAVHEGGRHMSLGLAALPENIAYGVFGFSPSAMPDIAVVTDPEKASHSRVFSTMPQTGIVLVDEKAPGYVECLAAAKASGIKHIIGFDEAAHGNLKALGNKSVQRALKAIAESLLISNVKTFDLLKAGERYTAFKVKNIIDLGRASKTLVLDSMTGGNEVFSTKNLDIPKRVKDLNLVYTARQMALEASLQRAIKKPVQAEIKDIVPEVLTPGDFVVFKKPAAQEKIEFQATLRAVALRG